LPGQVVTNGQIFFTPQLKLWLNAQQMLAANPTLTNGQIVTPVDISGQSTPLIGSCSFSSRGVNGLPGLAFANNELMATNLFNGISNCTIAATFCDMGGSAAGQTFLVTGGWSGGRPLYHRTWWDNGQTPTGSSSGGEAFWQLTAGLHGGVQQRQFMVHVETFNADGSNVWITFDGKPVYDDRIQTQHIWENLLTVTNLWIGGDIAPGNYFQGYLSDFRVYNNVLPDGQLAALNNYLCSQARIPVNSIHIEGDSIQQGLHTTVFAGPAQLLNPYFPNFLINSEAESGRTSQQELTNVLQWVQNKNTGQNFALVTVGVNDFTSVIGVTACQNQEPVTLANVSNICVALKNANVPCAVGTIISSSLETNGAYYAYDWRAALNTGIRGLTNLATIMDFAGQTPLGTNGAYANMTFYNADQVHPLAFGYTNMLPVYVTALGAMINPQPLNYSFTNSPNGFLASGTNSIAPATGFVTVVCEFTNTQVVWLTNQTQHTPPCIGGNTTGVWTNWDTFFMPVTKGDSVLFTNISGSGGSQIVSSIFTKLF
jgi:hypothetical protein